MLLILAAHFSGIPLAPGVHAVVKKETHRTTENIARILWRRFAIAFHRHDGLRPPGEMNCGSSWGHLAFYGIVLYWARAVLGPDVFGISTRAARMPNYMEVRAGFPVVVILP